MDKFFIFHENASLGPFNIEELKSRGLRPEDLIWFQGSNKWWKAIEAEALVSCWNEDQLAAVAATSPVQKSLVRRIGRRIINKMKPMVSFSLKKA
ncbi:MAG: DUF4339 domain-containing protein [Bacteroidetes bacterium]|nr:MAG: DUF4339 domain-containing protein [Bacteroidota bacterium]